MTKIALLKSSTKSRGGLEKHAEKIRQAFVQKGAEVTLLAGEPSRLPSFLRLERFDAYCERWLKEHGADIVFGMDRTRRQTHLRAGNGVHAAYLESRTHTDGRLKTWLFKVNPLHRKILEIEKTAFEDPGLKTIFANSHMVKNEILSYYDVDPKKIEVVHNGVEWHEMGSHFASFIPSDRIELLFVGHGFVRKGLKQLIEGLKRIKGDWHLSVVGNGKEMAAGPNVTFYGAQANITPFYQKADALIIPSFYDPFANVTVEALAMGLFVVSSKFNGGAEILNETNGAIIEDLLDRGAMADALQKAMQKKTLASARMRREGVKHLDFSHQLNLVVEKTLG